jgi:hypothetical protein
VKNLAIAALLITAFLLIVLIGSVLTAARRADERQASIDDDAEQDADDRALDQEKDRLYGGGW